MGPNPEVAQFHCCLIRVDNSNNRGLLTTAAAGTGTAGSCGVVELDQIREAGIGFR